ncbi:type IV pilus biogenesis/stability protein PilW [Cupriavidus necator]|uniref:Type IV pilus biogenesis/stability protein PilW n=1 Tax=Cupriavidus necator TaxID=106590 RepID=A0A367PK11_CUPNE|nr:type IV pilus biogenesis/stability protein PilW [Cupriavidus necator]QQX83143.1 type IV pilus biogenesis/stability protein PilW [Cupriavidus necator]RCJ07854.1 type IV pilus biogenesis/stability protein PilW [Cupriavidus necator]
MIRLIAAALLGLLMLSGCQLPHAPAQDPQTASDQTDARRRAGIRLQLATNYLEAGQNAVALDEIKQAIAIDPALADAYHVRALIYMNMNERTLADDSFRTAVSMRANDGDLLNNYGWFLCQEGRYGEAVPMLQRAMAAPSAGGPAKPLISLGACELRQGHSAEAEKNLKAALGHDRNNPVANTNLALVFYRRGDFAQARQYVQRVNSSQFVNAQSLWLGARIAHRQGDSRMQDALGAQLRSRFPDSRELTAYEQGAWDE